MTLSGPETFFWGALGGITGYALVFVLPWMLQLARGEIDLNMRPSRLVGLVGLLVLFVGLGGMAAYIVGDATEAKHAIAYGLGFEGILKCGSEAFRK